MREETDADATWVRELTASRPDRAVRALREAGDERRLFQHLVREHASEGRSSYVEIDAPLELYAIARLLRPRHVVEVGVSSGVSSAYLLAALAANAQGTLHSVDLPQRPSPRARGGASWSLPRGRESGWAVPIRLRARWDLRLGDKRDVLPLLADELPDVGLFVYDVPHDDPETFREFRWFDRLLASPAVAIADHGPSGGMCVALRRWAALHETVPVRRHGLGLCGFRRA